MLIFSHHLPQMSLFFLSVCKMIFGRLFSKLFLFLKNLSWKLGTACSEKTFWEFGLSKNPNWYYHWSFSRVLCNNNCWFSVFAIAYRCPLSSFFSFLLFTKATGLLCGVEQNSGNWFYVLVACGAKRGFPTVFLLLLRYQLLYQKLYSNISTLI